MRTKTYGQFRRLRKNDEFSELGKRQGGRIRDLVESFNTDTFTDL